MHLIPEPSGCWVTIRYISDKLKLFIRSLYFNSVHFFEYFYIRNLTWQRDVEPLPPIGCCDLLYSHPSPNACLLFMICVTGAVRVITPTAVLFRQIFHFHISPSIFVTLFQRNTPCCVITAASEPYFLSHSLIICFNSPILNQIYSNVLGGKRSDVKIILY